MAASTQTTPAATTASQGIALGSGTTVQEVNNLLKQHAQMSKMFKIMGSGGSKMQQRLMSQLGGRQRFGR